MRGSLFPAVAASIGVGALLAGCSSPGTVQASPTGDSLQVRLVMSSDDGDCTASSLDQDGAGDACDRTGTTTYHLAQALGEITPSSVKTAGKGPSTNSIALTFDEGDKKTLADVTRKALHKQMAILLNGRVVAAPQVMAPITTGKLSLVFESASEAHEVATKLRASNAR